MLTPSEIIVGLVIMWVGIWTVSQAVDREPPHHKQKSFWAWGIISAVDLFCDGVRWVFSTAPFRLISKIPRKVWELVSWMKRGFLTHLKLISVLLTVTSMIGLVSLIGTELMSRELSYLEVTLIAEWTPVCYAGIWIGSLMGAYGYWREEVRK